MRISKDENGTTPTLLGLASSLSRFFFSFPNSFYFFILRSLPQLYMPLTA